MILTDEHHQSIEVLRKDLEQACTMSLRLPKPDAQYVILTDASFYAAGYVLMIEDYITDQSGSTYKTYVPVSFGSKIFTPTYLKLSIYAKEFLAVHFAFDTFAHILWGSSKPVLVLTDNKSLTRFFQAKTIPSSLWTCVDHVLNFNFVLGHIPGKANAAADYLSRIHLQPHTKLELRFNSKLPVADVHLNMGMQVPDNTLNSLRLEYSILCTNKDISGTLPTLNALHAPNPLDTFDLADKKDPLDLQKEQLQDPNIRTVLTWFEKGTPSPSPYMNQELAKYLKHFDRLELHQGVLYRKFFDHTGRNITRQYVVPKHLRKEVLYRVHNSKFAGHSGITKTATLFRQYFYFPNFVEALTAYVKNCSSCLQVKPVKHATQKPPLLSLATDKYLPGDMLQIDLVGRLPDSSGFTHILTAKDTLTKYLFAIPLRNASAPNIAKQLFQIFMRTTYLPKIILSDMGTAFTAKIMQELCKLLENNLNYATIKHPQTVGSIERTHASLKQYLGIYENHIKRDWHAYVDLAVFVHNTSYHATIGCTPTFLFHGRQPITPLDLRFNNKLLQTLETQYDFTSTGQDKMNEVFSAARDATITAYNKYRHFYDRKASAAPLKKHSYCLLLNPKLTNVNDYMGKSLTKWLPLYRVEIVLTNSNYIIRKVGTHNTQCVHRIRLRPIQPQYTVDDLPHINPADFTPDPITRTVSEPALFDEALPDLLSDKTFHYESDPSETPNVLFYYVPRRALAPAPAPPQAPPPVAPAPLGSQHRELPPLPRLQPRPPLQMERPNTSAFPPPLQYYTDISSDHSSDSDHYEQVLDVPFVPSTTTLTFTQHAQPSLAAAPTSLYPSFSDSSTFSGFSETEINNARLRMSHSGSSTGSQPLSMPSAQDPLHFPSPLGQHPLCSPSLIPRPSQINTPFQPPRSSTPITTPRAQPSRLPRPVSPLSPMRHPDVIDYNTLRQSLAAVRHLNYPTTSTPSASVTTTVTSVQSSTGRPQRLRQNPTKRSFFNPNRWK